MHACDQDSPAIWQSPVTIMISLRLPFLVITTLLATVSWAEAAPGTALLTGYAHDRETGVLMYTENHRVSLDENGRILTHTTSYRKPDGTVICEKWLDYSKLTFAPDFELNDLRDGHREGGKLTDKGYLLYSQANSGARIESGLVEVTPQLVSDAGFDLYVRARLDQVLAGKSVKFDLAVASEQTSLRFEASLLERSLVFNRMAVRIKVQPATLLRLLVAPIILTYDTETGELLRYEGLSNIRKENGNRHDTRIDFPPDKQQYIGVNGR